MAAETGADAPRAGERAVNEEKPPPILRSWRNLYLLVLAELGVLVLLFWALGRWAS